MARTQHRGHVTLLGGHSLCVHAASHARATERMAANQGFHLPCARQNAAAKTLQQTSSLVVRNCHSLVKKANLVVPNGQRRGTCPVAPNGVRHNDCLVVLNGVRRCGRAAGGVCVPMIIRHSECRPSLLFLCMKSNREFEFVSSSL